MGGAGRFSALSITYSAKRSGQRGSSSVRRASTVTWDGSRPTTSIAVGLEASPTRQISGFAAAAVAARAMAKTSAGWEKLEDMRMFAGVVVYFDTGDWY